MEQRFLYKSYFFFCILMRPAISFLKSKNLQFFVKKKFSLLYPDRYLSSACFFFFATSPPPPHFVFFTVSGIPPSNFFHNPPPAFCLLPLWHTPPPLKFFWHHPPPPPLPHFVFFSIAYVIESELYTCVNDCMKNFFKSMIINVTGTHLLDFLLLQDKN